MQKEKDLNIHAKVNIDNKQWLFFQKYIISVNPLVPSENDKINKKNINNIELNFYNNKTFQKEFTFKK